MSIGEGGSIALNSTLYRIERFLGRGAIADVYLAVPEGQTEQVVIRLLQEGRGPDSQEAAAMGHEAAVLEQLNQLEDSAWPPQRAGMARRLEYARQTRTRRGVIALLDSGRTTGGRPCNVQELAPAAYSPPPAIGLDAERQVFAVFAALVRVVGLCHSAGLSLKDFDPASDKTNRVRVALDSTSGAFRHLKVIDWNVTGGPELKERDLLYLGSYLYYALSQSHITLDGDQPPDNLMLDRPIWRQISLGSRRLVERLLHRSPSRRYQRARDLLADVEWWQETLSCAGPADLEQLVRRQLLRPDRQRLVADLLSRLASPGAHPSLEQLFHEEVAEQQKLVLLDLDQGKLLLRDRRYDDATREFERVCSGAVAGSELARQAWIYGRSAEAEALLTAAGRGAHAGSVGRARQLLIDGQLAEAYDLLAPLIASLGGGASLRPLERLAVPGSIARRLAQVERIISGLRAELPNDLDALARYQGPAPNALVDLASRLVTAESIQQALAPGEPDHGLRRRAQAQHDDAGQVRAQSTAHGIAAQALREAQTCLASARAAGDEQAAHRHYAAAAACCADLAAQEGWFGDALRQECERWRDAVSHEHAQARECSRLLAGLPALFAAGDYLPAREHAARVCAAMPAWRAGPSWYALACSASARLHDAGELFASARAHLGELALADARQALQQLLALDKAPLEGIDTLPEPLPDTDITRFVLARRDEATGLLALVEQLAPLRRQIDHDRDSADYEALREALQQFQAALQEAAAPPGKTYQELFEYAAAGLARRDRARAALARATPGGPALDTWLPTVVENLEPGISPAARELLAAAAQAALRQLAAEPDPRRAIALAAQAADLLQASTDVQDLLGLRDHLSVAADLEERLGRGAPPAWLAGAGWADNLSEIEALLKRVTPLREQLRAVAVRSDGWQARYAELIERKGAAALAHIRELARNHDFGTARDQARAYQEALPASLQPLTGETWAELNRLAAAVEQRTAADRRVNELGYELRGDLITLAAAAQGLAQISLPDHPDVEVDDLVELRQQLAYVTAEKPPDRTGDPYRPELDACRHNLAVARMALDRLFQLKSAGHLFRPAVDQQIEQLEQAETTIVERARVELASYGPLPGSDPLRFARIYALLDEWRAKAPVTRDVTDVAQALASASAKLDDLKTQVGKQIETLDGVERHAQLTSNLDKLVQISQYFSARDFAEIIACQQAVAVLTPPRLAAGAEQQADFTTVLAGLDRYKESLVRLRAELWPTLFGSLADDTTALSALEQAVDAELAYAHGILALAGADGRYAPATVAQVVQRLQRASRLQGGVADDHWLLGWHRRLLTEQHRRAEAQLREDLATHVEYMLAGPPAESSAAIRVLLRAAEEHGIAEQVCAAIVMAAERHESLAANDDPPAETADVQSPWTTVLQASEEWQGMQNPIGDLRDKARRKLSAAGGHMSDPSYDGNGRAGALPAGRPARGGWAIPMFIGALLLVAGMLMGLFINGSSGLTVIPGQTGVAIIVTVAPPGDSSGPLQTVSSQIDGLRGALAGLSQSTERQSQLLATLEARTGRLTPTPAALAANTRARVNIELVGIYAEANTDPNAFKTAVGQGSTLLICNPSPTNGRVQVSIGDNCDNPSGWVTAAYLTPIQ